MWLIEKYGSGIKRSIENIERYGLPIPKIEEVSWWIQVEVYDEIINYNNIKSSVKSSVKIVALIEKDKYISIPKLSKEIWISTTAVENNIKKLKNKRLLKRVGPAKGGYWEVLGK